MKFSFIPPGSFLMGATVEDDEKPVHKVTLTKGFFLGVHQVTQAQWQAVMSTAPSYFKGANRPVENISWNDCKEFCTRLTAALSGRGRVELPTEAEWESACRAGTTTEFHFGEVFNPDVLNYDGNESWNGSPKGKNHQETTDVGSFTPNAWSLYDLHGNVWEWCEDAWEEDFYQKSPAQDPICKDIQEDVRVLRGGSWSVHAELCRAAYRRRDEPAYRNYCIGFRVCFRLD